MIKVKINLLPKEIRDRRKGEKFILLGLLVVTVMVVSLGFVYVYNGTRIADAETDLAKLKSETRKMEASIQSLQVYEQKLAEINSKKSVIDKALGNKIEWSKELEELMIVTPNDVSLTKLSGDAKGLTFAGTATEVADSGLGHKPVAKWLLRLAGTSRKPDVWLTSSDKTEGSQTLSFSNTLKYKEVQEQPAPTNATAPNQAAPNNAGK
jgi:Tfp pilus assembly protein PilN